MNSLTDYLSAEVIPPHIVFNPDQSERSRNINNSPYLPSELKTVHGASTINMTNDAGKKKVVIAITVANNFPPDYIQKCFDVFCTVYGFALRTIEVINLNALNPGQYGNPTVASQVSNQELIDTINTYVNANGTNLSSVTPNNRTNLNSIPFFGFTSTAANNAKVSWLGELILNFWAIAMNPNAHLRVINAASAYSNELANSVIYASTDSNFASNPYGTTDYVNMSWGDTTPGGDRKSLDDTIYINPRICYFAAAGNYRWAGYPATSSNVMCVGGASVYYNTEDPVVSPSNPYLTLWVGATTNSNLQSLGGGTGFSHSITSGEAYSRPAYQSGLAALAAYSSEPKRACPDMCSLADPNTGVLVIFPNSDGTKIMKFQAGGTSLASPLLCGLFSHLSQQLINEGKLPLTTRTNDIGYATLSSSVNLQTFLYDVQKMSLTKKPARRQLKKTKCKRESSLWSYNI